MSSQAATVILRMARAYGRADGTARHLRDRFEFDEDDARDRCDRMQASRTAALLAAVAQRRERGAG